MKINRPYISNAKCCFPCCLQLAHEIHVYVIVVGIYISSITKCEGLLYEGNSIIILNAVVLAFLLSAPVVCAGGA